MLLRDPKRFERLSVEAGIRRSLRREGVLQFSAV